MTLARTVRHGDAVTDLARTRGKVWAVDRDGHALVVLWEDGRREVLHVDDVLVAPGECIERAPGLTRYAAYEPCAEPTVPGEDYCPQHGGAGWL